MRKPVLLALLFLAVALLLGAVGCWMLFTTFMAHDDEGYVLWSVRQFCAGRPLYTEVYSQYGPAFYAWYRGWQALTGLAFTSESARWLTLGYWLLAAGAGGWMVLRLTGRWLVALAGCLLSFAALQEMIREPFHPGGFLAALTAVGTAFTLRAVVREKGRSFVLWGGATGTLMALTKINVGVFFLVALGSWVILNMGGKRWSWLALGLVAGGTVAAPWVLMKLHREEEWIQVFLPVFIASALALLSQVFAARRPHFRLRSVLWIACSAAVVTLLLALFGRATGTPWRELLEGVLVAPLRHPGVVTNPILWREGALECAIAALVLAVGDFAFSVHGPGRAWFLACCRLAGGLAVLVQLTGLLQERPFHAIFQFGPALAWAMVAPLQRGDWGGAARARAWLGWCAVWQLLQAYPVAGSQVAWGSFLFVPLLVVGVYEALVFVANHWPRRLPALPLTSGVLVALGLVAVARQGWVAYATFQQRAPLGLPGAAGLRLDANFTRQVQTLSRNCAAQAGLLFTTPGMLSFNLWSQKPTPTAANVTVWGALLSPEQKQAIAQRLLADRTAMVISRTNSGRIYAPENLLASFQPAIQVGDYILWTRQGTSIFPLGTARLGREVAGKSTLELYVSPGALPIHEVVVRCSASRQVVALALSPRQHSWRVVPMDSHGQPSGEAWEMTSAVPIATPALVEVTLPGSLSDQNLDLLEVVPRDPTGAELETLCFNKVAAPTLPLLAPNEAIRP